MTRLPDLASDAAAWSRRVDLPIPGSPPTSTADPMTKPPPVTRSSSRRPVAMRAADSVSPLSGTRAIGRPEAVADLGPAPTPESTISSTIEFHSPQPSQRPCQRTCVVPQDWQTKALLLALGIGSPHDSLAQSSHGWKNKL